MTQRTEPRLHYGFNGAMTRARITDGPAKPRELYTYEAIAIKVIGADDTLPAAGRNIRH